MPEALPGRRNAEQKTCIASRLTAGVTKYIALECLHPSQALENDLRIERRIRSRAIQDIEVHRLRDVLNDGFDGNPDFGQPVG